MIGPPCDTAVAWCRCGLFSSATLHHRRVLSRRHPAQRAAVGYWNLRPARERTRPCADHYARAGSEAGWSFLRQAQVRSQRPIHEVRQLRWRIREPRSAAMRTVLQICQKPRSTRWSARWRSICSRSHVSAPSNAW